MSERKLELKNYAIVEGILAENDLERVTTDGVTVIRGSIVVKVMQEINKGELKEMFVPVRFYSKEMTNKGTKNPSFTSLETLMNDGVSISAAGEENASCVSITNASVTERAFYGRDGKLVSYPELRGSFVNIIRKDQMNPRAVADIEGVIVGMKHEVDAEGIETGVFALQMLLVGWNEYSEIVDVKTNNPQYVSALEATYDVNTPICLGVKLHFSTEKKKILEEVAIGEPMERTITQNIRELVLVNAKPSSAVEIVNLDIINRLKQSRLTRLEEAKAKQESRNVEQLSTAPSKANLGFEAY